MEEKTQPGFAWGRAAVALLAVLMLASAGPASAGDDEAAFDWTELYAGGFGGFGRTGNEIVDIDGFSNWGQPGWSVDYDDIGGVGGVLLGKKFALGPIPLRLELDSTFGSLAADTNRLDPQGRDETAKAKFRWIATARAGLEHTIGPVTLFVSGGLSLAGIANSVTDIDFGPNLPTRKDPDDSFHSSSTELGWVIGGGIEAPLAAAWTLRLEGSYLDFGRSIYPVNRSGNNRCGPGNPRRSCPYAVENELGVIRLAIIRRFDW